MAVEARTALMIAGAVTHRGSAVTGEVTFLAVAQLPPTQATPETAPDSEDARQPGQGAQGAGPAAPSGLSELSWGGSGLTFFSLVSA